jgi:hypothetical protein
VIQPVDSPTEASPSRAPAGAASGKSFAALLGEREKAAGNGIPDGETWTPVAGHRAYAKIVSGPRRGLYVNLALGERHGETFRIEHRAGKTLHVYSSGQAIASRTDMPHISSASSHGLSPTADQPPKGELWAPVPGTTAWADILGGRRDGLFVNTSGNSRQGMAFQVVVRGGKTYHMYGSGRHRLMVEIRTSPHHDHPHPPAAAGGAAPSAPTGGVTAPDAGGVSAGS